MPLEIPNLSLAYVLLELKPFLEGSFVNKVQQISADTFKFKLHTKDGTKDLVVNPSVIYFTNYKLSAPSEPKGFASFLRKQLDNKKILSASQHEFDRIIQLEFDDFFLIAELFADGNLILTDKSFKIISCFRKQEWKDRKIERNAEYKFPAARGLNPAKISLAGFKEFMAKSKADVIHSLIKEINIAPQFAEEVCFLAGIEKSAMLNSLSEKQSSAIFSQVHDFYSNISQEKLNPLIMKEDLNETLLPFPLLSQKAAIPKSFKSLNEALDLSFSEGLSEEKTEEASSELNKKIAALDFSLGEQKKAKGRFEKVAATAQQKAELIYSHYAELEEILNAIQRAGSKKIPEPEIIKALNEKSKLLKSLNLKKHELIVDLE